jgi:hypothetical protein
MLLQSCNKGILINTLTTSTVVEAHEGFVVFQPNDAPDLASATHVGTVDVRRGFVAGCNYEAVLDFVKSKARAMGANAIKIIEVRPPDIWVDPCQKIKAEAYKIGDISSLEREIIWHKARKLKIRDFKASTENRPFVAATSSTFRAKSWSVPYKKYGMFEVEAVFFCRNSYFKNDPDSIATLAHEQIHFDITELFARRLVQRVQEKQISFEDLNTKVQPIVDELSNELQQLNDKFDSEVYPDPSKEAKWQEFIKLELEKMAAFENKQLQIKM